MPREALVYPVFSRRSGGLSLGIDPFRGRFTCNYDCVYCEVPLNSGGATGSTPDGRALAATAPAAETPEAFRAALRAELDAFFSKGSGPYANAPLKDLCVAGSGEPSLSPNFSICLEEAARSRREHAAASGVKLVVITNGTRLGNEAVAGLMGRFVDDEGLEAWVKLDAGSEARYRAINRPRLSLGTLIQGVSSFARAHPVVIQTMLLAWEGKAPSDEDYESYRAALETLLRGGARLQRVQLYTVARLAREAEAAPLPDSILVEWAARIRGDLPGLAVEAYGEAERL